MIRLKINLVSFFPALMLALNMGLLAQGPRPAYFYQPSLELPWGECHVYLDGGSRFKIPFLPVISQRHQRAPLGISNYSQDIRLDAPIVFIGNGAFKENIWNCYLGRRANYTSGEINVSGKVVLFCYDFPDQFEPELAKDIPLEKRLAEAFRRQAAGVLVYSLKEEYPFLYASYDNESEIPALPAITIPKSYALSILASAGLDGEAMIKEWQASGKPPAAVELISKCRLRLEGKFQRTETQNFIFSSRSQEIPAERLKTMAEINEKALAFLLRLFQGGNESKWRKVFAVYFRDYDSKTFYTHHWGRGLGSPEGIFLVHSSETPDFGLAVHENAHVFADLNWGDSTSFMNEGVGRYAEAQATDKDRDHLQTLSFLREKTLFPLEEMLAFSIGIAGPKTEVGYSASGSFVGFLIARFGLAAFQEAFKLEARSPEEKKKTDTWEKAFGRSLQTLEKEWLSWLAEKHGVETKFVLAHLERIAQKQKALEIDPRILDSYAGQYEFPNLGIVTIVKEEGGLIFSAKALGKAELFPESETKFQVKAFDAAIEFLKNEKGEVTEIILYVADGEMRAKRIK